jgi:hypothetical protein
MFFFRRNYSHKQLGAGSQISEDERQLFWLIMQLITKQEQARRFCPFMHAEACTDRPAPSIYLYSDSGFLIVNMM